MSKIALLNDSLRRTFNGGKVVMTDGVGALPEDELAQLLERVRAFDEFTPDNDPYGEHDFGTIKLKGQIYFFKVDYYAPDMDGGSEDPAGRYRCDVLRNVMTILNSSTWTWPQSASIPLAVIRQAVASTMPN
jgi:hypothetical protein